MSAGRRDQRITFQRNVPTESEHGDQLPGWTPLGDAWAAVHYGRGDERRQAASEQRVQSATFVVATCAMARGVTVLDRIVHAGQAWNIIGIVPREQKGEIEYDARRAD